MPEWRVAAGEQRNVLGEGPTWSASRGVLFWVDIFGKTIHQLSLTRGATAEWSVPERVGFVVERKARPELLVGLKSGVASFSLDSMALEPVCSPEVDRPQNRLNDAKVDPCGRLWFGSKDDDDREASGALYRLDPDLQYCRQDDGYRVTNGPAFSADGRTMWHADSLKRVIYVFDIDSKGSACNRRTFVDFPSEWGLPDGMTVDAESCLWVAHWGGARISRFTPNGELDRVIHLPATQITSIAFAGESLDRMFVTSARLGCENEPLAGALFEVHPGVRGVTPTAFAG
jgi:xylono-1,5-lactonase